MSSLRWIVVLLISLAPAAFAADAAASSARAAASDIVLEGGELSVAGGFSIRSV